MCECHKLRSVARHTIHVAFSTTPKTKLAGAKPGRDPSVCFDLKPSIDSIPRESCCELTV